MDYYGYETYSVNKALHSIGRPILSSSVVVELSTTWMVSWGPAGSYYEDPPGRKIRQTIMRKPEARLYAFEWKCSVAIPLLCMMGIASVMIEYTGSRGTVCFEGWFIYLFKANNVPGIYNKNKSYIDRIERRSTQQHQASMLPTFKLPRSKRFPYLMNECRSSFDLLAFPSKINVPNSHPDAHHIHVISPGEGGIDRGVVGYWYPDSEQEAECS